MSRPALLAALLVLGLSLAAAGCGGEESVKPTPDTVQETVAAGDAAAGKQVFESTGCGSCHTYGPAGSNGNVGPDLDEVLKGKDAEFIHTSIVNPNAEIAQGFQPNVMPGTYGQQLSEKQIADLVAFLRQS